MELPQLVVELVGDYSKLMEDIKKARVEAVKQAQLLEKDLNLTIGVDDRSLKKLNEHFDLKVTHFKQTQSFFKNNPLKVYVDDRELTNLNKEFKKSSTTKQKVTRVVEVDETVVNNNKKSTSNNSDSGGKKESTKDVVDELKKGFADIRKQIRDQATGEVLKILAKPAKDFMTGFSEGIANDFGKQVSKGLRTVFAKQLGLDFKKMGEMAGESLLDAFGIKRKKTTKEKPPTSTTPENNSSVGEPLAKPSPKKRKEPEPVFESISVKVAKQNARNFSNNVRNAATINNNINPGEISSTVLGIKSSHQSLHKVLIDLMKKASNSGDFSVVEKIYKEYQIKSKEALAEINRLIALAKKNGATQEEITKLSQAKSPITRAAGKSSQISQTYQKTKRESERFETVKEAATGMGLDAIAGLRYGLDNKAFAKFGLENATAYLLSIRDAFQIKSPSKVMFSIGKNIIQGLIGGLDQAFPGVQAQVKKLFDSLTKDFAGFKISRLFDSGISGAIKYLATSAKKAIFSNTTNTIGDFAEEKLKPSVANFIKNSVNKTKSSSKNTLLDYYIKGLVGDAGSLTPDDKDGIKDFFTAVNFIKNSANKTKSSSKTPLDYIKGLVGDAGSLISDNKNGIKDFFTAKNFLNLGSKAAPFAINSVIKKSESLKSILGLVGIDSEKVNIGKDISDYFGDLINKTFKPIIDAQSGKLKSATTDFFQTIKNALSDARKKGELTLGQLFQSVATAGATSILSSLGVKTGKGDFVSAFISMLSGGSKGGFMAKILPLIVPMLGLKSLNLGETIVKILSGNSAIKPGFLMDVFKSITGVNLKQTPGFDTLKNMVGIGSKPKERLELENVNNKQIQENLKNINLSGGTTGLINNFGQTIIKEVLKNLGITGVKAGVMQGMANEQLAKLAPEISKMLGKGRLDKLMSGYTSGDVDSISKELNAFAQSKGISNLDISQIKGFVGTALAAITGLQARFNKEGFALGNSLSEGFKNSKRNWLNSIDDAAYAAKKALGQANMQDVGENVKKRLSRGSVIPVEMFDEFYGHLGRTVKKAIAPKNYSKEQQDALGSDAAGSAFSQSAILVPIQTMASAIAPLFLPLLPIIQTAKMMADSLFPYVNKLVDMAQRVEPIQRQLNFAGGGTLGGKAELDYVRSVGKKYNTSVEFGAGAYGQLQVAARGTKMAGEGVRELYEGISASLNKLGISGQQQSLIFMAYTQMLAKGRVSMEELRQQLGEKFPPAMSVFAKAMGLSIPAMVEMVSNGGVLSDEVLPKVGKVLLQEFGGVVNSANSVIDALARLSNAGFDIAVGLTNSFGGAMAGAINVLTSGLNVISNSISKISSIVSTSLITMVIATTVGLKTVLRQNPIAGAVSTLQNFLMSSFKNMTMALAPFILGIVVDFGDTMIGAQKDIGDNMAMGVTNMIRGAAGVLEKLQRDWTRLPLFGDVIGKENKNPLSGLIEGVKSLTKILPSGVVELGALTFMLQSLGVLLKAKVFEGLGSAIGGMIGAVVGAVKNLATTMSGLRVLFADTSTMNFGDFAKREAMINAAMGARVALMEKLRVAAMALASVMATVGAAFLLLSFAKGDFTNPLGDSVSEMAKGVNDSIKTMKSSLAELAEKFKTVGDSAENAAKKFIQLPSKGAELNPQYLLGMGGKSIKFDDVVNKGDKQDGLRSNLAAFLTNIFTPVDESKTPVLRLWDKVKPLFGRRNQQEDVKKALAEAKSYGIEEFFTGKESFLNISKSQTLGTFRDVRSSVKGFEKELSNLGLLGGEKELLAKNKDLGRQINIIKDIDKKLITLGKERQVLAQRRDSKSIIKVGELDKKAVDLQVQRDKELKPLSRFSSAAEQATTFVKDLREEINKSTAPLQLKIKLLDEIKPLEDFARRASAAVKKYLPVNFAENNYKELAAGLKDAQINYEAAKNNAEINLSGRQKDLYSSNNLPGQISYENTLAQIEEQETQAKNLSTALKVKTNTLREMSAIINVDREQDQKKEMDDLKKQIADDTVNLGRLTSDIAKSKFDLTQSLYQQNKQIVEYYITLNKQAQEITQVYKELVNTNNLNTAKNKIRSAVLGYQDNFITQFADSIIQILDTLNQPVVALLQGQREIDQAKFNLLNEKRQIQETQRSNLSPITPGNGKVTSEFGWRTIFGQRQHHNGIDYEVPIGTPVKAPTSGKVSNVFNDAGGGLTVTLSNINAAGQKVEQSFLHLSQSLVKVGDVVQQGQVIAKSGNSGSRTTGEHLDYRVKVDGKYINPRDFLKSSVNPPVAKNTSTPPRQTPAISTNLASKKNAWQQFTNWLMPPAVAAETIAVANPNQEKNLKKTFKKGHGEFRPSSSSSFTNPNLTKLLDEYKYNIQIREDKIAELKQIQSKYDPKKDRIHYIGLQSLINGLTIENKIISRLSQDTQKGLLTESRYVSKLISARNKEGERFLEANSNFSRLGGIYLSRKVPGISWLAPKVDIPLPPMRRNLGYTNATSLVQRQKDLLDGTGRATSKPVAVKLTPALAKPNRATFQKTPNTRPIPVTPTTLKPQPQPTTGNWMKTIASTYGEGDGFHGKKTSNGETFNKNAMTAAMNEALKKQLGVKWGDMVEAVNPKNGKSVTVRINDHGPYEKQNGKLVPHSVRGLDLSAAAANKIGVSLGEVKFRLVGKNAQAQVQQPQEFVNPQLQQAERNLENTITNAQTKINTEASQSYITATAQENKALMALDRARMENRRSPIGVFREIEDMGLNLSQQNPERELLSQKIQIERNREDKLHQITMAKFDQEQIKGANEKLLAEVRENTTLRPAFKSQAIKQLESVVAESKRIIDEYDEYLKLVPELTAAAIEKLNSEYLISENLRKFSLNQQISQAQASGLRSKSRGNLQLNAQADLMDLNSKYAGEISGLDEEIRKESDSEIVKLKQEQKKLALIAALRDSSNIQRNLKIQERDLEFSQKEKLNSSNNAISSEVIKGKGLFGVKDKSLEKAQALSQIKMDFERERMEIEKLGESGNYSSDYIEKLTNNLNKLNELKLDNVAKEFNMFTEAISGVKGDMDGIFKDFFMNTKSFGESISSVFQSILNNLANMASKELSNQLFTSVLGGGNKNSGGGIFSLLGGLFGGGGFSPGAFDFSDGFSLGGGLDFGSATLPSFAKGGMVGDLLNKERSVSGFNPRLIIANEGERVLTPKETKLWNQLNSSNKLESFSSGGMIGEGLGNINNVGRSGDTINITPNVNINNEGGGNINKAQFEKALEAKIQETIKQERRPGGSLNRGGLYDR